MLAHCSEVAPATTFRDGSPGAKVLSPGQTFTRVFDKPGTYNYFCSFHPYMTGSVMVE